MTTPTEVVDRFHVMDSGRQLLPEVPLFHHTVHQQIAYDDTNGLLYVSQMMHGGVQLAGESQSFSTAERLLRGDFVINRLVAATGARTGWMICRGMGHGHFGVEPVGTDSYIWAEADSAPVGGSGTGRKVARFKFVNQAIVDSGGAGMEMFNPLPGMVSLKPVLDISTRRIAIRWLDADDANRAWFDTYDLDQMKAGVYVPLSRTPQSTAETGGLPSTFQSHALFGQYHYVLTGSAFSATNPAPGNSYIIAIHIPDGKRVDQVLNRTATTLQYREPEGLTVRYAGTPQLVFAFGTQISTPHLLAAYSWDSVRSARFVPGQTSAGMIDGFLRDDAGDGTLGIPDCSLVPYTYAPLLGRPNSGVSWSVDQFRQSSFAAFKGSPDGYGVLRSVGSPKGATAIAVIPAATGVKAASPDGNRAPDYTWGPRDFAIAVRHPGASSWVPANTRAYVAFTQATNSAGMRLTTTAAQGPWDAELADSAAVSLTGLVNLWDGEAHTFHVSTFGQNVFCLIDGIIGIPFRAPRAYKRNANGSTDAGVFSNLPSTGDYTGYDCRGSGNSLWSWSALQPASGDFFFHDMGPLSVQTAPATTYTPATTPSGETWVRTGTVTGSKDGVLLAASSSAYFNVSQPYGILSTRWGVATAEGGLLFRYTDANNYYLVTSTGIWRKVGGTTTQIHAFTSPLISGSHVVVRNWANQIRVWVNGVSVAYYNVTYHVTAKGVGFLSPASGSSQFRYIAYQPMVSDPVMPTS
ncbi:hypothetical protein ACWD7M_16750 [Streptomyces griseus]